MFEKLERKLVNVLLFFDLFKMKTKIPTDFRGVMHTGQACTEACKKSI